MNENTEAMCGKAGAATNHSNCEAKADANEVTASPKEIAAALSKWLLNKGISQRLFASKILNRSQRSLSDYLSKPPDQMPKTHGRVIWLTLDEFLKSKSQQDALVSEFKTGN